MQVIGKLFGFESPKGPSAAEVAAQSDSRQQAVERNREAAKASGDVFNMSSLRRQLSFNDASKKQQLGS